MTTTPGEELEKVRQKLYGKYEDRHDMVDTSILYVQKLMAQKKKNDRGVYVQTYNFQFDFILQSIAECIDNGFALDGVNYVITGNRMYMPTYKAFKNKIYMVYPESVIDLQLVHEGDDFTVSKESGAVIYQHNIANPFSNDAPITGAYCVIKNKRGEFLELLNTNDYNAMRDGSKQPKLWDKWESEFFLKSVIKRACKRHFNDITSAIEEKDNQVIGLEEVVKAEPAHKAAIIAAAKGDDNGDTDS